MTKKKKKHDGCCGALFNRICPCLHRFFTSKPEEYKMLKTLLGFPFGAGLGIALYFAVIDRMKFPEAIRYSFGGLIGLCLALGFGLSTQVRCIAFLVLPTFFGKSGRGYVGTFAVALLLSGPIANIMHNGGEVARSISCSTQLMVNLTKARLELRFKPIHDVMIDLQNQGKNMENISAEVREAFNPIAKEIKEDEETERYKENTDYVDGIDEDDSAARSDEIDGRHKANKKEDKTIDNYERKLDYRCEDIFNIGVLKCRKVFRDAEVSCMEKLSVAGYLLCLPLKLTVLCQLAKHLPSASGVKCDSSQAVNQGFSGSFKTADEASDKFQDNFKVNMQYKLVSTKEELDKKTAEDVALGIKHEFESRQRLFNFFMLALQRFLAFLFIRVFISAFTYHKKYISSFDHDNIYMTGYFRKIDCRRNKRNKRPLIPLKKAERKKLILPAKPTLTGPEKSKLVKGTFKLIGRIVTYGVIIFMDRFIYEVLDIIQRHSRIDFKQKGEHHIELEIYGKGIVGHLVRTLLRGFNQTHTVDQAATNFECLPRPTLSDPSYVYRMGMVFGVVWLLMFFEAFGLRMRRVIAAFFYPKREKKRILYLYNDMLKKRKGYLKHTRERVRDMAKERELSLKTGLLVSLRTEFPRMCGFLRVLSSARRKCLICEENESKRLKFHFCRTQGCNAAYCVECWVDVKKICYACAHPSDLESDKSETDA